MAHVEQILALHRRISAAGFGLLELPPAAPLTGPTATILLRPTPAEQTDIAELIFRLTRDFAFRYNRDQLIITYEHGKITLARLTFVA